MGTVTTLEIPADHPAFAGHFPGTPILPGVVLLDETLRAIETLGTIELASDRWEPGSSRLESFPRWQVAAAKFQTAVRPGEPLTLEHERLPNGAVRFVIRTTDRAVANGLLIPSRSSDRSPSADERTHGK